jgi:hypothetical protein
VVQGPDGKYREPNVFEIDDSEITPNHKITNWLCMGLAVGTIVVLLPFFLLCLWIVTRGNNAEMVTSSIQPTL